MVTQTTEDIYWQAVADVVVDIFEGKNDNYDIGNIIHGYICRLKDVIKDLDVVVRTWSYDCVERVLPIYEHVFPNDHCLRTAMNTVRRWSVGEASDKEKEQVYLAVDRAFSASISVVSLYSVWYATRAVRLALIGQPEEAARNAACALAFPFLIGSNLNNIDTAVEVEAKWQLAHLRELVGTMSGNNRQAP